MSDPTDFDRRCETLAAAIGRSAENVRRIYEAAMRPAFLKFGKAMRKVRKQTLRAEADRERWGWF